MSKLLKIAGILALPLLIVGYFLWPVQAGCLSLADSRAPAAMFRIAALTDPSDPNLCEGLALLSERKIRPALNALDEAADATPSADRWSVQGYLAQALALDRQSEKALENWETAIAGAVRAGNVEREAVFRGDRGLQLARDKRFTAARARYVFRLCAFGTARQPKSKPSKRHQSLSVSRKGPKPAEGPCDPSI